ncbi:MAG: radical SAM protein [Lachnospiraceae bacterium]|nr:radical SAM protein [Lachnospiraceae bacterium]
MNYMEITNSPCNLCPRNCMAERDKGQKGYCLSDNKIIVARAALHMWEEPCISGETGSGTVFFSGCNLRCIYCQNYEIAAAVKGREVSVSELSEIFLALEKQGASNINLVTPDHYVPEIIEAVLSARKKGLTLPIVYNGSGYEKPEVIRRLKGIVDIFLTDFKYMEADLAERFSHAPDYPQVAKSALEAMVEIAGEPVFDKDGMMQKGVIVRHLLLPGHKKNAKDVIRYVYENYGDRVYISLMNQYTPFERLKEREDCKELCRRVTKREYENVLDYMIGLGVKNAFIQEGDTAKESFIPDFEEGNIANC